MPEQETPTDSYLQLFKRRCLKDFIGVKCFGAYFGMPENHFTWKGKCNVLTHSSKIQRKNCKFKDDN